MKYSREEINGGEANESVVCLYIVQVQIKIEPSEKAEKK